MMKNKKIMILPLNVYLLLLLAVVFMLNGISSAEQPNSNNNNEQLRIFQRHKQPIPKLIWTYWNSDKPPPVIQAFIDNWKRYSPDHTVQVVTPQNMKTFLKSPTPRNFEKLSPQGQADWMRLALLVDNGGFWLDASLMLTRSLNWIHDMQQERNADSVFFYLGSWTHKNKYPMLENWFMASIPNTEFMKAWMRGFEEVLVDFDNDGLKRAEYLKETYGYDMYKSIIQGIPEDWGVGYLTQHVEVERIMQVEGVLPNAALMDAIEGPYFLAANEGWSDWNIAKAFLKNMDNIEYFKKHSLPGIIKLNGQHRRMLVAFMEGNEEIHDNSILVKYLNMKKYLAPSGIIGRLKFRIIQLRLTTDDWIQCCKQVTISPIDGKSCVERDFLSKEQAFELIEKSHNAFIDTWKKVDLKTRGDYVLKMVDAMLSKKNDIAREITVQMGRPIRYSGNEVNGFAERARYMVSIAAKSLADTQIVDADRPGFKRFIKREPLGVVLVVPAWNYPLLTAVNGIVPALLAGNTVILKHSQQTPLCAERIAEAFQAAGLPEGVFQVAHMSHDTTADVIKHPSISFVNFTGSVSGGREIYKSVATKFIGCGLELGGNDPAYVRHDANLDNAVENLVDGAFFNSGQCCCGIERIYVHHSIYDEFISKFVQLTNKYVLGDPLDPETTLGPMVKVSAAEYIRKMVDDAVSKGARPLIDSKIFAKDQKGTAYLAPQVLINVDHSMSVMKDEQFGPVVGIMKVSSDEEAIKLMNNSQYGLTASIWTKDQNAAIEIGNQLETGTVFQNRCDYVDPGLAWTGVKNTGFGCTLSQFGLLQMTRPKSYHLKNE